jgi:hypothetical protein
MKSARDESKRCRIRRRVEFPIEQEFVAWGIVAYTGERKDYRGSKLSWLAARASWRYRHLHSHMASLSEFCVVMLVIGLVESWMLVISLIAWWLLI